MDRVNKVLLRASCIVVVLATACGSTVSTERRQAMEGGVTASDEGFGGTETTGGSGPGGEALGSTGGGGDGTGSGGSASGGRVGATSPGGATS